MANTYKATNNGSLAPIPEDKCYIIIPGSELKEEKIVLNNLPDISDSKAAVYNNEAIIGRSFPLYTYSHSADRTISMQLHFFVVDKNDVSLNLQYLRAIQSAVYPREGTAGGAPFVPPPVCVIRCGNLLGTKPLCCVLQSYSVKFPTEVAWSTNGGGTPDTSDFFTPFRFDVDTQWLTVYSSVDLPYQTRIVRSGR